LDGVGIGKGNTDVVGWFGMYSFAEDKIRIRKNLDGVGIGKGNTDVVGWFGMYSFAEDKIRIRKKSYNKFELFASDPRDTNKQTNKQPTNPLPPGEVGPGLPIGHKFKRVGITGCPVRKV